MNANLRNCPQCGRLFSPGSRNICNRCLDKEEEDYMVVRKYVRDHPGASVFEASEETGVDEDKIMQFIRDGRLVSKGFKGALHCEGCGQPLDSGRFCKNCINERDNAILRSTPRQSAPAEKEIPTLGKKSNKMYIRDRDN